MKHIFLIIFLLFPAMASARQPDSAKTAELGRKLAEYYKALEHENIDIQKRECDFLIEAVSDSLLRQFVALDIYGHYMDSPLMGTENVAVHIYDKWFATGAVPMKSESDRIAAKVFAEFNRRSLIGEKAPALNMSSQDGTPVALFDSSDAGGKFRILYFYDTDCAKCKVETILLKNLLSAKNYPAEFYAVYVGDDFQAWKDYSKERIDVQSAIHLWDPSLESDFQRKYGVLQTPRLFLVGPDGTILGRGLDVKALETMLDGIFAERTLVYGTPESEALFDGIFAAEDGVPSVMQVKGIADYIADRTLARGDTLMFRQLSGDYLYYLASRAGEGFKEGLKYHIDKNILTDAPVWKSADDSLKVIGFATIMADLLAKAAPGSEIPSVKVPGELYTWKRVKKVKMRLSSMRGDRNIIMFVTDGCEVCAAQKQAALDLLACGRDGDLPKSERKSVRKTCVLVVNMDAIMSSAPSLASCLMDAFDLSSLPFIVETDSDGIILRRYLSLAS